MRKDKIFFIFSIICVSVYILTMQAKDSEPESPIVNNDEQVKNLSKVKSSSQKSATKQDPDFTEDELNNINIFKNLAPSVVYIQKMRHDKMGFLNASTKEVPSGSGSGFIWNHDGYIVTNYHVIHGGDDFRISFHNDPTLYQAKIAGRAPRMDLAVLKLVDMPENLHPIELASSNKLLVGQKTVAIGNPFGLDHTMTTGIISALGRSVEGVGGVEIRNMIQTDASINPGNSGGPLLNSRGQLIGVNTMIYSNSGSSAGVGFAVPSNIVKDSIPQLIKYGKIMRPLLGVELASDQTKLRFGVKKGIVLKFVPQGGPAYTAGLRGISNDRYRMYLGDVITHVNQEEVNNLTELYYVLQKYKPGDKILVRILRNRKAKDVEIVLTSTVAQ